MCSKPERSSHGPHHNDPRHSGVASPEICASDHVASPPRQRAYGRGWVFAAVFVPLFSLFLVTARTDLPYHIDAATNVFVGWSMGTSGSPILTEYEVLADPTHHGTFAWIVPSDRGPVAQYPPGTALLVSPLYALWPDSADVVLKADNAAPSARVTVPVPNLWPAAIVAAGSTAAALSFLALLVLEMGGSTRTGVLTAFMGAAGTSAWSVAADQLWQHGPNMLWIALGIYLAATDRWLGAGFAFGALALTRPPAVLIGVSLGLMLLAQRDLRSARRLLGGVIPGVVALLAYNRWLFTAPTVSGGYGGVYAERARDFDLAGYATNIASALFAPDYGLLVWSPFVGLVLVAGLWRWKQLPLWAVAAAIGGGAYMLLQLKLNRASGGTGFSYYRYPLETLTAAAPVMFVGWQALSQKGKYWYTALLATAGYSVLVHLVAVI